MINEQEVRGERGAPEDPGYGNSASRLLYSRGGYGKTYGRVFGKESYVIPFDNDNDVVKEIPHGKGYDGPLKRYAYG
jgi:hypothetical protein